MKMKKISKLLVLAIVLMVGIISCKKDSFNINQNPNQATDSTIVYNLILPAAQNNTARVVARNWGWLQNWLGYWARSGTYAPSVQEETYNLTASFQQGIWTALYDNLYDYESMAKSAKKSDAGFYVGIARIMKAHDYAILIDIYNNVPYSEALKGSGNITPKYDKGVDIYKDLLRQIDTAITEITSADLSLAQYKTLTGDDIMFAGDPVRWAQFGNTLKLRILTKCMNGGLEPNSTGTVGTAPTYVPGIDLPAEFAAIVAEGSGFLTEDADVQPGYQDDKGNPFYNSYVADNAGVATANSVYYKANSYAIGYYSVDNDPRLGSLYTPVNGGYRGVPYGTPSDAANAAATLSGIGVGLTGTDATGPQLLFSAAESYFLQAECMNRGFLAGDPKQTLADGILASFLSLGAGTAQDVTDYLDYNVDYPDVDYDASEAVPDGAVGGLYTIISQKWFALNGIAPWEVWSDYRRIDMSPSVNHFVYGASAGYDPGPPISVYPQNTATEIPVRLLYPQTEVLYNATNLSGEGTITSSSHVFWDLH